MSIRKVLEFIMENKMVGDGTSKVEQGIRKVTNSMGDMEKKMSKSSSATKSFANSWKGMVTGFNQGMAAIQKVVNGMRQVYDIAKSGAELELAERRFNLLSDSIDTTADVLLTDLKAATQGLYSDAELIASAGQMMSLGLAKTHDEAVRLANVAGALNMNMNQLVLTLTNRTTMRFDTLNVATAGFKDRLKALEDQGYDTNDAFTEAFLQQAEEQIEKLGGTADTAMGNFMELEASVANFTDELKSDLGAWLSAAGILDELNAGFKRLTYEKYIDELVEKLEGFGYTVKELRDMTDTKKWYLFDEQGFVADAERAIPILEELLSVFQIDTGGLSWIEDFSVTTVDAADASVAFAESMDFLGDVMSGKLGESQVEFLDNQREIALEINHTNSAIEELENKSYLTTAQKEELDDLYGTLGELKSSYKGTADEHEDATNRILFDIMQQVAAGQDYANDSFFWNIAENWGMIDKATLEAYTAAEGLFSALKDDTAISAAWLETLGLSIEDLPDEKQVLVWFESAEGEDVRSEIEAFEEFGASVYRPEVEVTENLDDITITLDEIDGRTLSPKLSEDMETSINIVDGLLDGIDGRTLTVYVNYVETGGGNVPDYRAEGGVVVPGQRVVIGERGPEELIIQQPGVVVSNRQLQNGGGGAGVTVQFNGPNYFRTEQETRAMIERALIEAAR